MKDIRNYILTAVISALATLTGSWVTVNSKAITKTQVEEMITPDRQIAKDALAELRQLREEVTRMNRELGEIRGIMSVQHSR